MRNLRSGGGSSQTENAVELGLKWLADHQADDGDWGDADQNGLALLGFLGAGYTDRGSARENKYAKVVRTGLRKLMVMQNDTGSLSKSIKAHAIATTALCEAYWMTRNPRYRRPAQKALDYIAHQRARMAGWGDFRTTAWALVAFKSGKFGGLDIDPDAFEGVRRVFSRADAPPAFALLTRVLLGEDPRRSAALTKLVARLPATSIDSLDVEQQLFAILGAFQCGGRYWKAWNQAMKATLLKRKPDNVSSTAMRTMCFEVYYRYNR